MNWNPLTYKHGARDVTSNFIVRKIVSQRLSSLRKWANHDASWELRLEKLMSRQMCLIIKWFFCHFIFSIFNSVLSFRDSFLKSALHTFITWLMVFSFFLKRKGSDLDIAYIIKHMNNIVKRLFWGNECLIFIFFLSI